MHARTTFPAAPVMVTMWCVDSLVDKLTVLTVDKLTVTVGGACHAEPSSLLPLGAPLPRSRQRHGRAPPGQAPGDPITGTPELAVFASMPPYVSLDKCPDNCGSSLTGQPEAEMQPCRGREGCSGRLDLPPSPRRCTMRESGPEPYCPSTLLPHSFNWMRHRAIPSASLAAVDVPGRGCQTPRGRVLQKVPALRPDARGVALRPQLLRWVGFNTLVPYHHTGDDLLSGSEALAPLEL
jgi:hypothetical protein